MDAESETLVNSALSALLKGNNTTISIAHRLSTIKRSDTIIVLSSNGQVAEQGPYKALSRNPNGAFTKLMEFQLTGADATVVSSLSPPRREPEQEEEEEEEVGQLEEQGHEDFGDGGDGRAGESAETPVVNVTLPEKPSDKAK